MPTIGNLKIEGYLPVVKLNQGIYTEYDIETTGNLTVGGDLVITDDLTLDDLNVTGDAIVEGNIAAKPATAVPATAGAVAAGAPITLFTSGPSIYVTSDAPTFTAVKGSLCINTGGSSSSTRLFVNNGTTNWVAVTTAS